MQYLNAPYQPQARRKLVFTLAQAIMLVLLLALFVSGPKAAKAEDLLAPEQAFSISAAMADPLSLDIHYQIAPAYYMYQERFELRISDANGRDLLYRASTLTEPADQPAAVAWQGSSTYMPAGEFTYDPTFEQDMEVYRNGVTLRVGLEPGAPTPLTVSVTGQGCADLGLCYPPMQNSFELLADGPGYRAVGAMIQPTVPAPAGLEANAVAPTQAHSSATAFTLSAAAGDTGMAAWLHQAPLWQILLLSVAFGALLSFTPCVLPMVPILLAIITGSGRAVSRWQGLALAAIYVLGVSVVYTALGIFAGLLGAGLAAWLQSPWVLGSFALLLALFALAMLDVFTLQAPGVMQSRLQSWQQKLPGGQFGAVFIMGMLSALIVGPCVAAPLAGVLLFISQTGDWLVGGSALFAMAWGEGLLLLVLGAGAGALVPRAGAWMNTLKASFGILLLATAWWMLLPLLPSALYISGWVVLALWAALLFWSASLVELAGPRSGAAPVGATTATGPMRLLLRALALIIALWGLAQGAGLLAGGQDMLRPLAPFAAQSGTTTTTGSQVKAPEFIQVSSVAQLEQQLANTSKPVMLDFYADWCVACLEMEKFTFIDPNVAAAMAQFLLLQVDVTKMTAADKELLARFKLFGPPGIMFFDAQGKLLQEQRVIGFKNAQDFAGILQGIL